MKIILIIIIIALYNSVMVLKKRKEWDNYKKILLKIKVFNLGSSHGEFSFNYKKIENGVNLGNESQTFYYDLKEVVNYFKRIENKAICFLTISYFSFSERKYWRSIDKIKYLKELKFSLIDKEDKKEAFIMRYLPIVYSIIKKIRKKKI